MAGELDNPQTFGGLLRARRVASGLTQEQLAERSGLGVRTIRDLERDRVKRPHRESIGLLATALGLPPADIGELARAGGQPPSALQPGPPAATPVRPAQLPAGLPDFTGRRAHVSTLSDVLTGTSGADDRAAVAVGAIIGVGGAGKTSLAVHVAQRIQDQFPDGQFYVDLRGAGPRPLDPGEVLARFLRDLGIDGALVPAEQEERAARYRSLVAGRRMLMVLDNAHDTGQVRPLLPGGPGCAVLVTSRRHLPGLPTGTVIALEMLESGEAEALFARIVGRRRAAAEPDATAEVVAACAGLPLAIRIAGTRLASRPGWTIRSLADRLADQRRRLDELGVADLAVRSSFETSYRALPDPAGADGTGPARAFRLLGLPAAPSITLPAASALLGQSARCTEAALQALVDAHLLDEPSTGQYRLHDLLRAYAAERAAAEETAPARQQALRGLFEWQLHTVAAASLALEPRRRQRAIFNSPATRQMSFASFDHALRWCEAERDNLLASARQAAEHGMDDLAAEFPIALYSYLDLRGWYSDLIAVGQIGLPSARALGDREIEADNLNNLGLAYGALNHTEAAAEMLGEALAIFRQMEDPTGEAAAWGNLGNAHQEAKRYPDALHCFQHTLTLARRTGIRAYERTTLSNLAEVHNAMGQFSEAAALSRQALAMCREDGDQHGEGFALVTLADAYRGLRCHDQALATYQRASDRCRQIGARLWQGLALLGLGDTLLALGRGEQARASWQDALAMLDEISARQADEARARLSPPTLPTGAAP